MTAYEELSRTFTRLRALQEAAGVLQWDMSAMMPSGGAEARTEQLATLSVVCHEILADPSLAELFDRASDETRDRDAWTRANLKEMHRRWLHETALESDLVEALSKACKRCEMIWRKARPAADFAAVKPALAEVLNLTRQAGAAKAERLGRPLYDALLDQYEPDGSSARIDAVFEDLAAFLPGFLDDVLARQGREPAPLPLQGPFPREKQEALARRLMAAVGFDFEHGRLDVSLHPFCGGVPDDVRITTRYDEDDFMSAIMGVLHETGHAMYERGLPKEWRLQPVGEARGMTMHESQSLMIEMQASRSRDFLTFLAPLAREAFGGSGPAWQADNLLRHYTAVKPDFIRVDADEVTYPAHVILRYRLEKALIAGDMSLDDLPGEWNRGMQALLGITPPDDRLGCLQDIHWYDGAWGYFPTYTLGAMTAAQLFAAAKQARPEIPEALGRGDFAPLMGWLAGQVHAQASSAGFEEIVERATGRPLAPAVFKAHLKARYLS
ncbi:MAG TPA: carboxypeptidase M32 [Kiloniellaceae bacterium]